MKKSLSLIGITLGLALLGMAGRPPVSVRFFVEANAHDTERFAKPIKLKNPPRDAYIEQVPSISERSIKAIYPFPAADGTWGCAFKLDEIGRLDLENASASSLNRSMVAFVSTKTGVHQVEDMLIDKPIHDGVITIHSGLTELEIAALAKEFRVLGQKKQKPKKGKFF